MEDTLARIWEHLVGRLTGPLTLRLFMRPTMPALFAVRDDCATPMPGDRRSSGRSSAALMTAGA